MRYIVVSALLHVSLILLWTAVNDRLPEEAPIPKDSVAFELIESKQSQGEKQIQAIGSSSGKVKSLFPQLGFKGLSTSSVNLKPGFDRFGTQGTYGVMDSLGVEEYTPMIPYFAEIWKKVDTNTDYPEDLVKQRITGSVTVHVVLDEKGVITPELLEVTSSSDILKTYVTVILLHSLREPLREVHWLKSRKKMPVVFTFDFSTYSTMGIERQPGRHVKNMLAFNRTKYVDPRLNEVITKFMNKYVPPIVPIPGGFYVDFVRAYQMISAIGKPDEDQMRLIRIKKFQEEMLRTVQKEKDGSS